MTMRDRMEDCSLFDGLPERYLDLVLAHAAEEITEGGDYLFREGAEAPQLYVILSGQVRLTMMVRPGAGAKNEQRDITLVALSPGEAVGFWALIRPYRYAFSAIAALDCACMAIDGKMLSAWMESDAHLGNLMGKNLVDILVRRLTKTKEVLGYERSRRSR